MNKKNNKRGGHSSSSVKSKPRLGGKTATKKSEGGIQKQKHDILTKEDSTAKVSRPGVEVRDSTINPGVKGETRLSDPNEKSEAVPIIREEGEGENNNLPVNRLTNRERHGEIREYGNDKLYREGRGSDKLGPHVRSQSLDRYTDRESIASKKRKTSRGSKRDNLVVQGTIAYSPKNGPRPPEPKVRVIPRPDNPIPHPVPIRPPSYDFDFDIDDDDEGDDDEANANMVFKYQDVNYLIKFWGLKILPITRTKEGSLPRKIVKAVRTYKRHPNSVALLSFENFCNDNDVICAHKQKVWDEQGYDAYVKFNKELSNFFFHSSDVFAKKVHSLSWANSQYADKRRVAGNYLSNLISAPTYKKYAMIIALIAALWCMYRKSRQLFYSTFRYILSFFRVRSWFPANNQKHELISTFPTFSVYFEEIIKMLPYGWKFIAGLERIKYGNWKTYKWHRKSSHWSFTKRVQEHFKINSLPSVTHNQNEYNNFAQLNMQPKYEEGSDTVIGRSLPPRTISLLKPEESDITAFPTFNNKRYALDPKVNYTGIYPILFGCGSMVKMAPSFDNIQATIYSRVNAYHNSTVDKNSQFYQEAVSLSKSFTFGNIDDPAWFSSLRPEQKRNIVTAIQEEEDGVGPKKTLSAKIKDDELICAKEKSVARFIVNLSGIYFAKMGKLTSEIADWLSTCYWNKTIDHPVTWKGQQYAYYYTCGSVSSDLDMFVKKCLEAKVVGMLLMGDDNFKIYRNSDGKVCFDECDFSRYDRTHHSALRELSHDIFTRSGFGDLVTTRREMYKKSVVFNFRRGKALNLRPHNIRTPKGRSVDMLLTGEPGTSLVNTVTNAIVSTIVHSASTQMAMNDRYAVFGLVAKHRQDVSRYSGSFLKGVFLEDVTGQYKWVRLPSFLLKFGKTLEDFYTLDKRNVPEYVKCQRALLSQWLGYGDMRVCWFYSRLDACIRKLAGSEKPLPYSLPFWKVTQSRVSIDNDEWNSFMLSRYRISEDMQDGFLKVLEDIDSVELPVLYFHKMLELLDVDY